MASTTGGGKTAAAALGLLLAGSGPGPGPGPSTVFVRGDNSPNPEPFQLTLPDGSLSEKVKLVGSAQYAWMETAEGHYTVVETDDGDLVFAEEDEEEDEEEEEAAAEAEPGTETAAGGGGKKKRKKRKTIKASACKVGSCNPAKYGLKEGVRDSMEERARLCEQATDGAHARKKGQKGRRELEGKPGNDFCKRDNSAKVSGVIDRAKKKRKFKKKGGRGGGGGGPAQTVDAPAQTADAPAEQVDWADGDFPPRNLADALGRRMRLRAHRKKRGGGGRGRGFDASSVNVAFDTEPPTMHRAAQEDDDDEVTVMKNIVVNIRFSDHASRTLPDTTQLDELFNKEDCDNANCLTGSVKDHFLWNSYGRLRLESDVFPWVTVSKTEEYYADEYYGCTGRFIEAIGEALDILDRDHDIDFSQYDMDGNGYVDAITVLHSGYGSEWGGNECNDPNKNGFIHRIWSHKWDLGACNPDAGHDCGNIVNGKWTSDDGTSVSSYHVSPGLWGTCGHEIGRIGVIVHETLHFLGLPDLYDGTGGRGLGTYCTMGNSWGWDGSQRYPPSLNPWAKWHLGWLEYTPLDTEGLKTLKPSAETDMVYIISDGFDHDKDGRPMEYLLVENKIASSFDAKLPQEGIIVWHIDEPEMYSCPDKCADWANEGHPGQDGWPTNGNHYLIAVLPRDGGYRLEKGENNGDAKLDVIDPNDSDFALGPGPDVHPNTDTYLNGNVKATGIVLKEFRWEGKDIKFRYENPHAGEAPYAPATVELGRSTYFDGEAVEISFDNPNDVEGGDRIALYADGTAIGETVGDGWFDWVHACGTKHCTDPVGHGTVAFDDVEPGTYRAVMIRAEGPPHAVLGASAAFVVSEAPPPPPTAAPTHGAYIYIENPNLVAGQTVEYTVTCQRDDMWVGVYPSGSVVDGKAPLGVAKDKDLKDSWQYCCGEKDHNKCKGKETKMGKNNFNGFAPGEYEIALLFNSAAPYTVAASGTFHVASEDAPAPTDPPAPAPTDPPAPAPTDPPEDVAPTTVTATKSTFKGEKVTVRFDHPQSRVDDWLGIYKADVQEQKPGFMPYGADDWAYVCGSKTPCSEPITQGEVTFEADLKPGEYKAYVFLNSDAPYEIVAESEAFTVEGREKSACQGKCRGWCGTFEPSQRCGWSSCSCCDDCPAADMTSANFNMGLEPTTSTLSTLIEGGAAGQGVMFDVDSQVPLEVRSFSVLIGDAADVPVKVYTKEGSHEGHEDSPAAWTEICGATVSGTGFDAPADIPESKCTPVDMIPGEVRAFYVQVGGPAPSLHLTPAFFPEGTVFARNADLSVMVGKGVKGSFDDFYCQRQFNGEIRYVPEGMPQPDQATYPIGGNANNIASASDPVDGTLGSDCYCDDCDEGTCSFASSKCENEDTVR